MSSMYTNADIITELKDMASLLSIRRSSGAGDSTVMEANMLKAITAKLMSLKVFKAQDALLVTTSVNDTTLSDDSKKAIHDAIEARLGGHSTGAAKRDDTPSGQLLRAIYRYLTAEDWAWIRDPRNSVEKKLLIICARFRLLGIRSMAEDTKRWVIAVIVQTVFTERNRWPEYEEVFGWVRDFTRRSL